MSLLRTSSQAVWRHRLRLRTCSSRSTGTFHHSRGRRRRSFSDFSNGDPSFASTPLDERYLEKFTSFALNSKIVPLGAMHDELWEKTVKAIIGWFRVGGGLGLDSAGRLLHRLDAEYIVLHPFSSSFHERSETLLKLHKLLFRSWFDVYSNFRQSALALNKAGEALQRLIPRQADDSSVFPIDEFSSILDSWITYDTYEASRNAGRLLIFATNHTDDFHNEMSKYFEVVEAKLKESSNGPNNDHIHGDVVQRMKLLHDTRGWHTLRLPTSTVQELRLGENYEPQTSEQPDSSPQESGPDNDKKRVINAIKGATGNNSPTVEKLANKLFEEIGEDRTVTKCLIDFYIRTQNTEKASNWLSSQLEHWKLLCDREKEELSDQVTKLSVIQGTVIPLVHNVFRLLKEEDRGLSESFSTHLFKEISVEVSNPKLVLTLMTNLESFDDDINLPLYKSVIQALFKLGKNAHTDIEAVYTSVLRKLQKNPHMIAPEAFGDFLYGVVAMYTYRNLFNEAGACLHQAEKAFLKEDPKHGEISMISVDCYERMIQRKWYTAKTAPRVERTFQRLMKFYHSGYSNLRPNQNIFAAYIRARATTTSTAAEVEKVLDEMIGLYEDTGDDSCKPTIEVFNSVLLAYTRDRNTTRVAGKKSISLLEAMESFQIQPDTRSLNYVMQNINKSTKNDVYLNVCEIFGMFDNFKLEPDMFSRHNLLDACGSAGSKNRKAALETALRTFGDIRKEEQIGPLTYPILTKVLQRTLPEGDIGDRVATSAFMLCCEDGLLEEGQVKKSFRSLLSEASWNELYTQKLQSGNQEPFDWRRNVQ